MNSLASCLILAVLAGAESQPRDLDAVEAFSCDFGRQWDVNYDGWPDRWERIFGPGLPHYVTIGVEDDKSAASGRCLTIRANGAGARVESPVMAVAGSFSYKLEARLRVANLVHGRARISVEFLDDGKHVLQQEPGQWLNGSRDWADVRIGPINLADAKIRWARIALELEPGSRPDLEGVASLDEVWVGRLPKMTVAANSPFNVYANADEVEVVCNLSGIVERQPQIQFELLDASGSQLDSHQVTLDGQLVAGANLDGDTALAGAASENAVDQDAAYSGTASWKPPLRRQGFYTVRVRMRTSKGLVKEELVNVALIPQLDRAQHGEFGWSLDGDAIPMSFDNLATLLPRVAINWVKLPVWYAESEPQRGDQIVILAEKLAARDIEMVGVLDHPPAGSELAKRLSVDAAIADTFAIDSSSWLPLLDPVLSRLSLRVRWWQLGSDEDYSFSSVNNLERDLRQIREKLFRFGQEVKIGLGWQWCHSSEGAERATWDFQQYWASPTLTGQELSEYLALPARKGVGRWVLVEPLPKQQYDLETRARDLVQQMLAAKIHGADAIFVAHPFDDERGLMTSSGAPGELLLPWRTAASMLSGARYLGTMRLPRGSSNYLFETPAGDGLMVIWNEEPTRETLHLGTDVQIFDVWGRDELPERRDERQAVQAESLPKFVRGVDAQVAKWRLATRFADAHMPSVFGKAHRNSLVFQNTFPQGVGGTVELIPPKDWQVMPARADFKLSAGESLKQPFEIMLPSDAGTGKAPFRADFVIDSDRQHRFSVFLDVTIGDGEIELETSSRLEEDGSLVVEQRMVNHSNQLVDFKCLLYAPGAGRRRQRAQVFRLGASEDVKTYRFPEGAELVGSVLWLKAEEVNGTRVLNHRFVAEQ